MARTTPFVRLLLAAALLTPLALHSGSNPASADPPADQADAVAPDAGNRITRFDLALVSRTYNAGDDNWTIVADATLTSNRICLPIAFNCIVGEVSSPSNASLVNLECRSVLWNHLLVFRNHCLKEIFWAGHKQLFRFTWTTDPGVSSGTVQLSAEFGRGFLPVTFQQLAVANLTVDLSQTLEISKSCPDTRWRPRRHRHHGHRRARPSARRTHIGWRPGEGLGRRNLGLLRNAHLHLHRAGPG